MNSLVSSNLSHHPARTAVSIIGVSVGVILVVMTVGLVRGALKERANRDANVGVELMLRQAGQGLSLTSADMTMPVRNLEQIQAIPGVAAATPVGQNLEMGGKNGLGLQQIDGIDFASFTTASNLRVARGEALPSSGDVAIVDSKYALNNKVGPGDTIKAIGRDLKVVGVYEPESGARIKIPLTTLQEILGAEQKCSMIFIKCQNPEEQEQVAQRILAAFPDYRIIFTRDLPTLFTNGFNAFNVFLNVVRGLAVVISLLVILLTMYTSVSERTRQIGILKSLGASKMWIAWTFEKEALLISLIGVAGGLIVSQMAAFLMVRYLRLNIDLEMRSMLLASLAGMVSGALGALYPALRAASQDPIDALSYE
ncbi:MAG: ABC transporter permease [Acidobacteriota bacterium]